MSRAGTLELNGSCFHKLLWQAGTPGRSEGSWLMNGITGHEIPILSIIVHSKRMAFSNKRA